MTKKERGLVKFARLGATILTIPSMPQNMTICLIANFVAQGGTSATMLYMLICMTNLMIVQTASQGHSPIEIRIKRMPVLLYVKFARWVIMASDLIHQPQLVLVQTALLDTHAQMPTVWSPVLLGSIATVKLIKRAKTVKWATSALDRSTTHHVLKECSRTKLFKRSVRPAPPERINL